MSSFSQAIRRRKRNRRSWQRPQVRLHIAIIFLLLLSVVPIYLMLTVSFKNELQYQHERWSVSLPLRIRNYVAAWERVGRYIFNTLIVAVAGFLGMATLSTIGGFAFARMRFPFRSQLYGLIIVLLIVPWVLSFIPAYMIYADFGLLETRWALILPRIAGGSVFGIFLLRTFFATLPDEIFEAARIDGASNLDLIWRITLPMSLPILATLAVLEFIGAWNDFLWPFVAVKGENLRVISVALVFMQADTAGSGWGQLFAAYVLASLPLAILFFALGKFYVEGLVQSGIRA